MGKKEKVKISKEDENAVGCCGCISLVVLLAGCWPLIAAEKATSQGDDEPILWLVLIGIAGLMFASYMHNEAEKKAKSLVEEDGETYVIHESVPTTKQWGFVYVIRSGNFYKIGKTRDLQKRIKSLQTGSPHQIEIIHCIETDDPASLEVQLHNRFRHKRRQGEWFDLAKSDLKELKRIK